MDSPSTTRRSPAVKASWACVVLALAGTLLYLLTCVVGPLSRGAGGTIPSLLLVGQALAVVAGVVSFFLIREEDRTSRAVPGIVARSVCGIVVGTCAGLVVLFVWANVVIGF